MYEENVEREFARAIQDVVVKEIRNSAPYFTTGIWVAAETVDSNLSSVRVGDSILRFVPKLSGVSPSANDTVLMLKAPGVPLTIMGVLVGDITQAEV